MSDILSRVLAVTNVFELCVSVTNQSITHETSQTRSNITADFVNAPKLQGIEQTSEVNFLYNR